MSEQMDVKADRLAAIERHGYLPEPDDNHTTDGRCKYPRMCAAPVATDPTPGEVRLSEAEVRVYERIEDSGDTQGLAWRVQETVRAHVAARLAARDAEHEAVLIEQARFWSESIELAKKIAERKGREAAEAEVADLQAKVAQIRAVLFLACHHCGRLPDQDGDHSCPCPTPDSECLHHTLNPVAPLEPIRAALGCEHA